MELFNCNGFARFNRKNGKKILKKNKYKICVIVIDGLNIWCIIFNGYENNHKI